MSDLAWQLNEVLSVLHEVHVVPHAHRTTGTLVPVEGCEACQAWKIARDELADHLELP